MYTYIIFNIIIEVHIFILCTTSTQRVCLGTEVSQSLKMLTILTRTLGECVQLILKGNIILGKVPEKLKILKIIKPT